MTPKIKKRLLRTLLLSAVALVVGVGLGAWQIKSETAQVSNKAARSVPIAGAQLGGPFSLVDHNGRAVTQDDYAGFYKLIYFGFASCPAICPTELQKISRAMARLEKKAPEIAAKIQPLFITIDPQRDTVDVMGEYARLFHPRMVGLTGSVEQIEMVKKNYRVFAQKVQEDGMSDYTMDHSSFIYFMGPDNQLISMYRIKDNAAYITADIMAKL